MHGSIVIPAFNEAARIRATLESYGAATSGQDIELLVVVNGSLDETATIVQEEFLPRFPHLRLIDIPEQVGKGGALMRGFKEASGSTWIGYIDADGSTPPDSFLTLSAHLKDGVGAVIGSRWLPDSDIGQAQPLSRRIVSRLFNVMVRTLFGMNLRDTQCGAKLMSPPVLQAVLPHVGSTQWAFDVELLFHIRKQGYRIHEAPVTWDDREGSKVRVLRSAFEMTLALTRLRLLHSPFRRLVRLWDLSLGRRLYAGRLRRMQAIYRETP